MTLVFACAVGVRCPTIKAASHTLVVAASRVGSIRNAVLEVYWGNSWAVAWDSCFVKRYRVDGIGYFAFACSYFDSTATIPPIFYLSHGSSDFGTLDFAPHSNFCLLFALAAIGGGLCP